MYDTQSLKITLMHQAYSRFYFCVPRPRASSHATGPERDARVLPGPIGSHWAWSKACPMTNRLGIGFSVYRCLAAGVGQRTTACRRCSVLRTRPNLSYSPPLESIAGTARSVGLPSLPTRPRSYCTVTPLPRIGRIAKGKDSGLKSWVFGICGFLRLVEGPERGVPKGVRCYRYHEKDGR